MDSTGGSDMGMRIEGDGTMSFPSSSVMTNSTSDEVLMIRKPSNAAHPFFSAGWDSLVSLNHNENLVSRNEALCSNYQSAGNQVIGGSSSVFSRQTITDSRLAYFGSGNLSEAVVGSFSMPEFMEISDTGCLPNFGLFLHDGGGSEMSSREGVKSREHQNSEDDVGGNSLKNGSTRKRTPDLRSSCDPNESNTSKLQVDVGGKSPDTPRAQGEKKQKHEQNEGPVLPRQNSRQAKDNLSSGEVPNETYIHVRARRGQATNSHSLAERIRREKISERMRMLQELVPGCNKITGKAVMLDEIINYVQSLQQQVEFLSMKLATLIPDLCFEVGKPLPMNINSQHADATTPGLNNPGIGSFQHVPPGMPKGTLPISPSTAQYLSLSQLPFDSELHSLYQMGFHSNSAVDILKPEGHLKPEQ